jgi:hypothetical protein
MQKSFGKLLLVTLLFCSYLSVTAFSSPFFKRTKGAFFRKERHPRFSLKNKKIIKQHDQKPHSTIVAKSHTLLTLTLMKSFPCILHPKSLLKPLKPFFFVLTLLVSCPIVPGISGTTAHAAAPVTPIKNFKPPDSKAIALKKITDERNKEKMQEEMAHQIKCDDIEREQGLKARKAFEKAYLQEKIQKTQIRSLERQKLLYSLVDQGICPYVDVEGERQMYLFDYDIDLNKVPSSAQQKEMMKLRRDKKWASRREKERFIIKCIVEDLKLRGEDPLKYLEANKAKTRDIFNLKDKQLNILFNRYTYLMESQGSLSGIKTDTPFDMEAAATSAIQ